MEEHDPPRHTDEALDQGEGLRPGEKVRNRYGEVLTVLAVVDSVRVLVEEETNRWYHPTKLRRVEA